MRPEGMAQRVRMDLGGEAAQNGDALYDAANTARRQTGLASGFIQAAQLQIEKQGRRCESLTFAGRGQPGRTLGKVGPEGLGSCVAQRDVTLLLTLSADQDGFV